MPPSTQIADKQVVVLTRTNTQQQQKDLQQQQLDEVVWNDIAILSHFLWPLTPNQHATNFICELDLPLAYGEI